VRRERHFACHANSGEALLHGIGDRGLQEAHQGHWSEGAGGKVNFVRGVQLKGIRIYATLGVQFRSDATGHRRGLGAETTFSVAQTFLEIGDEEIEQGILVFVEDTDVVALFELE
jgi:hypothetical protein